MVDALKLALALGFLISTGVVFFMVFLPFIAAAGVTLATDWAYFYISQ